jgi:lipopolysaccharide export system protein LptC
VSDADDPSALDASAIEPLGDLGPLLPDAGTPVGGSRAPLRVRALALVVAYLPLLLMALLALGTWWLAKNTPVAQPVSAPTALRHDPDYTMRGFTVQRYTPEGPLRAQIEGDVLRHYPDTDTIEIDLPRIRAYAIDGRVTVASAARALSNGDASEVQLFDNARVTREATASEPALQFQGSFLHAFLKTEQVRSHRPVVLTRGTTEVRGDTLHYDNMSRVAQLHGRVHATFSAPAHGARPGALAGAVR